MNKNTMTKTIICVAASGLLAGCIGGNALTKKLVTFNVEVIDNRYARGGLGLLMTPVYGITSAIDVIILNSIGFWTGENPISGEPHIFDAKVETMLNINEDLSPELQKAPVKSSTNPGMKMAVSARMIPIDENTVDFDVRYSNGEQAMLRGVKTGEIVRFYMDGEPVSTTTLSALKKVIRSNT
jgi:hypothetical protein